MDIILGTSSKIRARTMATLDIPFKIVASNFDESQIKVDNVGDMVTATAKGKAAVLVPQYPNDIVITVDSNNFFAGKKYGKPSSSEEAREWLMAMSGKSQDFYTALVVTHHATSKQTVDLSISRYIFKPYGKDIVDHYLKQVDPTTMAIGWAPVGPGLDLLERFEGEAGAECGLPLETLRRRLREFGVQI